MAAPAQQLLPQSSTLTAPRSSAPSNVARERRRWRRRCILMPDEVGRLPGFDGARKTAVISDI